MPGSSKGNSLTSEEIDALHLPDNADVIEAERDESELSEEVLRSGPTIRILFVGGDERQAKHDETVSKDLGLKYPSIAVAFQHPGWGSNWKHLSNQIKSHLREYDAIVLSHLVRTNMGRTLRKMCDAETPWFPCSGTGPGMITASIVQAANRVVSLRKTPKI